MMPEQIAQQLFDTWYADAAAFTGPTARRTCIAAIAAAIREAVDAAYEHAAQIAERQSLLSEQRGGEHPDLVTELRFGSAAAALVATAIRHHKEGER